MKNYNWYNGKHPENILPALKYTMEETEECQDALTNIPDYVKRALAEFVTGARDIDKEWDAYLSELDNMGLSVWLKDAQAAYDRSLQ